MYLLSRFIQTQEMVKLTGWQGEMVTPFAARLVDKGEFGPCELADRPQSVADESGAPPVG